MEMNNYKKSLLVILLVFITWTTTMAQIRVTQVDPSTAAGAVNGFVYSLPQTVLKVDIVYQKTENIAGPFADYAEEYLGVDNYIKSSSVDYQVVKVDVVPFTEPDPSQFYFVQYPADRSKDEMTTSFSLSKEGCLLAYNTDAPVMAAHTVVDHEQTFIFQKGSDEFPFLAQYNKRKQTDTITRTISIDTVTINRFMFNTSWVDKSDRDKAMDAAMQIEKLREARYNLMSGYQEVNYGNSIAYMDEQMKKMERQYSELFIGKELVSLDRMTLYFVPSKHSKSGSLAVIGNKDISIQINQESQFVKDNSEPPAGVPNMIYYRIPASSEVQVKFDGSTVYSGRNTINQLGIVTTVPLGSNKLIFDPVTGNIVSIVRQ